MNEEVSKFASLLAEACQQVWDMHDGYKKSPVGFTIKGKTAIIHNWGSKFLQETFPADLKALRLNLRGYLVWAGINDPNQHKDITERLGSLDSLSLEVAHLFISNNATMENLQKAKDIALPVLEELAEVLAESSRMLGTLSGVGGGLTAKPNDKRGRKNLIPKDIRIRIARDYMQSGISKKEYPAAYPDRFRDDIITVSRTRFPKSISPTDLNTCLRCERDVRRNAGKSKSKAKK